MSQAAPALRTRSGRGAPVTIIGLLGVIAGAIGIYLGIDRISSGHYPGHVIPDQVIPGQVIPGQGTVTTFDWSSTMGWIVAIVFIALGALLLLIAIIPGRANAAVLPAQAASGSREIVMPYADLERYAVGIAERLDGVGSAKATMRGRTLTVKITSPLADGNLIRQPIAQAVQERVSDLGLSPEPVVRVRVK